METVKLSTIINYFELDLGELLTTTELEMPVVLREGIQSVSSEDVLEIVQASILQKNKGALILQ